MTVRGRRLIAVILTLVLGVTACTATHSTTNDVNAESDPIERAPFRSATEVRSPNGELRFELGLDELGRARYRVVRSSGDADTVIVRDSTLGLETSIGSFAQPGTIVPVGPAADVTQSFSLPHGKAMESSIRATTQTFQLGGPTEVVDGIAELSIDVWVTNTGAAFRYRLDAPDLTFTIEWERTSFAMPPLNRTWLQQHDPPGFVTPAYERLRSREATAASPGRSPFGWTFPSLFATNENWTLITETALAAGNGGSHFSPAVTDGEFLLEFADVGEGNGLGSPQPVATNSWTSPWRLIITSPDLGDIVESNHVRHLSPSADEGDDFSWVRPGRVSWSWWSDHASSRDADAIEPFIDLAEELGWEYSLVDANWNEFGDERLIELIDYAAERNVGLWLWYNSGGPNNGVTEAPRDIMSEPESRQTEFARLAELGVAGVKVDFFHSDKPLTIQLYRDILSDAANAQLMVNFHGSTVPRGWSVEFPNLMTMEAVRGAEIYTFTSNYQRVAARQNTVLPFTRNVVGSMDYTPVILGDTVQRKTTNSHELALAVVFESALLHLVDTPDAYLRQPPEIKDILATLPTVWDQTEFIDGEPESHTVIARRNGTQWWIGAINSDEEERVVVVDLDELDISAGTDQLVICDNPAWESSDNFSDSAQYLIAESNSSNSLRLELVLSGGCIVRIG